MLIALALFLQGAAPAVTSSPPPAPLAFGDIAWRRLPTGEDMARVYPDAAASKEVEGRATLECVTTSEGTLADCRTVGEFPLGLGFGEAALKLAPRFVLQAKLKSGAKVGGQQIRIPILFRLPSDNGVHGEDGYGVFFRCYGVTAVAARRNLDNSELFEAYGFFASQGALRAAEAKMPPEMFEGSLANYRVRSIDNRDIGAEERALKSCLDVFRKVRPPKP